MHGISRQPKDIPNLIHTSANVCSLEELSEAFAFHRPDIVVHAAAMSSPGVCDRHRVRAHEVNVLATSNVFSVCVATRTPFVLLSTDLVFDGTKGMYTEQDVAFPNTAYGQSKLAAERVLPNQELWDEWSVLRCSLMWGEGPGWSPGFPGFAFTEEAIDQGATLFTDQFRTPIHVHDVCAAILAVTQLRKYGTVFHCGGPERINRFDFVQRYASQQGLDTSHIQAGNMRDVPEYTTVVEDVSLDSTLLQETTDWQPRQLP